MASAPSTDPPRMGVTGGLRRLGTGLIAYGVIGLLVVVVGLAALAYAGDRIATLADRISTQVESLARTLDQSSRALMDAGATAQSFALTLRRTPATVEQVADTIATLEQNLLTVESQLASISILGSRPLAGAAATLGDLARDLAGLDQRLDLIAADLEDNRDRLTANATSLTALGVRLAGVADNLRSGVVEESLADVQLIITIVALTAALWTAVPAIGALILGWWLRRETRRTEPRSDSPAAGPSA